MTSIVNSLGVPSSYRDKKYPTGLIQLEVDLAKSSTLYLGNLSFFTTEEQIHEVFSQIGEIKRIIMGLDRIKRTPCGFAFVEYHLREDALDAQKFLNKAKVDERVVRCDIDPGFKNERQFGRGKTGGQVRDEFREDFDEGRGGWGSRMKEDSTRESMQKSVYSEPAAIPVGSGLFTKTYHNAINGNHEKRQRDDDEISQAKDERVTFS